MPLPITETLWNPEARLLITRLQGDVTLYDVQRWVALLASARSHIAHHSCFQLDEEFSVSHPFNRHTHKLIRTVMPLVLAHYVYHTALFYLFDSVDVPFSINDGRRCIAVAHVHHDAVKMNEYE